MRAPAAGASRPLRVLLLFEKEWDGGGLAPLVQAGEVELFAEGFDLFRFPANARLLTFDAWRFVERVCARYRGRIDAVVSNNEQFGALLAAVIAQRLGLPGNDPLAVCRAQHKLLARQIQQAALPQLSTSSQALPFALSDPRARDAAALDAAIAGLGMAFPLFVKPVKATFSVLARTVENAGELAAHLRFGRFERTIIGRLVAPFGQVAARLLPLPTEPTAMMLEPPVEGHQINVDGYVFDGRASLLGIVDTLMYAQRAGGAQHFRRFAYPSRIDPVLQQRVAQATRVLLAAFGFRHGFFNIEYFVAPTGELRFIELNPRLASQFVSLYREVEGLQIYRMLLAMAAGHDPAQVPRLAPRAGAAASFVFRNFDGRSANAAAVDGLRWLAARHPHARLATYHKRGRALAREYKWLGSHRYAVLNHAAADAAALETEFEEICARLGWPCASAAD